MNIVVVGRPNVGKSSLFNRLLRKRRSIVLDTPGVTRDRIVEPTSLWVAAKEYQVNLIDTGGLGPGLFEQEIKNQVDTALTEAHIVLFVMDIKAGLTNEDRQVWANLRKAGIQNKAPVIGVLNKADSEKDDELVSEFYALGLDLLLPISAEHNLGIEDLRDAIIELTQANHVESSKGSGEEDEDEVEGEDYDEEVTDEEIENEVSFEEIPDEEEESTPHISRIAIIGQPNVGKSTMLNAIFGEERTIVSPIAGTTVDPIDLKINWNGRDFIMVDTAGIRRKNKTEQGIEVLSVVQTKKTLERADLALLVMDAEKGVYDQDEKIAGLIEESGASVIMVFNKWDLQADNEEFSQKLAEEELRKKIRFLGYAPVVFTTAIDSIGLDRLFRVIVMLLDQRRVKISTRDLTDFIREESEVHNPHNAKFYMVHQSGRNPPTFVAHVNDPKKIDFSMSRHLVKAIRGRWGFQGTPIRFHFLKTKNSGEK